MPRPCQAPGISDLISNYGNHHWSSGIAETDHIETGQQRMVVPLYEDLQAYIRNSAVFGISTMTTPLLLMTGDSDGTVFWHQSVELYNIARRAKKNVVMLVYNGEDHGLRAEEEPDRLSPPHPRVVRPLPEGRARAAVDHGRRQRAATGGAVTGPRVLGYSGPAIIPVMTSIRRVSFPVALSLFVSMGALSGFHVAPAVNTGAQTPAPADCVTIGKPKPTLVYTMRHSQSTGAVTQVTNQWEEVTPTGSRVRINISR